MQHRPLWGPICVDAKAREKILLCKTGAASKGCYYCWQYATQFVGEGGVRRRVFAGWTDKPTFINHIKGEESQQNRDALLVTKPSCWLLPMNSGR